MTDFDAKSQLADANDLLRYLEVESVDDAAAIISENTDPDAYITDEGDELVLRMQDQGFSLQFPMTVEDFWEMVRDLEHDVGASYGDEPPVHASDTQGPINWDAAELRPSREPARVAQYRRLQSWYRATVLEARPGKFGRYAALGSYLDGEQVAAKPRLNFVSDAALEHAEERIVEVKAEGGTLDPVRLRQNMLSSMPLCFNLFGTMRAQPDFLAIFKNLFDPDATAIIEIVCEWAPQPAQDYLDDRTAFDAIVFYQTSTGPRFCGIETKYTEPFSETEYEKPRYVAVTRQSGWFTSPAHALVNLKGRKSNQLWRNLMLAAAVEDGTSHGTGWVAVVALADDPGASAATEIVQQELSDAWRLRFVSIESILDAADGVPSLRSWSEDFRCRYVGPLPD